MEKDISSKNNILICWKKKVEFDRNLSLFDVKYDLENIFRKADIVKNEEDTIIADKNI